MAPFFTIAVTTYNRKAMLKECLASILQQEFSDFEVLVGNNFTEEPLSSESLGISDSRVRILNRPIDLGQLGNMNDMLAEASGRYFTWVADDDMLTPQCLISITKALKQHSYPKCVFSSYLDAPEYIPEPAVDVESCSRLIGGAEFLRQYLSRKLKLIGCYGGFETSYLRQVGGMRKLGHGFSPYADNRIAIEAGLLDRVAYIDTPLFFFRDHDQSLSYASSDLSAYTSAQQELLDICEGIFADSRLLSDYQQNMYRLLVWFAGDIYAVSSRSQAMLLKGACAQLRILERHARSTGWLYPKFMLLNLRFVVSYLKSQIFRKK